MENYIKKQIWDKWDGDLRGFCLKTAVIDEMPIELCERLTGRDDSRNVLDNLCSTNSFVSKLSEDTYRYHHLFLDFLRAQSEYDSAGIVARYQIAAEYYMKLGDHIFARRFAYKSGDTNMIVETIHYFEGAGGFSIDEYMGYSRDFFKKELSDALCKKCPVLYITHAWTNFLTGNAQEFEKYLDLVRRHLITIIAKYPRFTEMAVMILADVAAGLQLEQNRLGEALENALLALSMTDDNTVKELRFSTFMHVAAVYHASLFFSSMSKFSVSPIITHS